MTDKHIIEITKVTQFIFTEKQLRQALGLDGRIISMDLFEGLSPHEESQGVSPDKCRWEIKTEQKAKQQVNDP